MSQRRPATAKSPTAKSQTPPPDEFRWRRQHGPVLPLKRQILDARGNIAAPCHGLSLLDDWEAAGRITPEMRQAGDHFHRLFRLACLDPLQAADLSRCGARGAHERLPGSLRARNEVHAALRDLDGISGPLGAAAWFVLGCELSLRQWAQRGFRNRPINKDVAAGILIGALGGLQKHFGY
jgi:hypothetical protein